MTRMRVTGSSVGGKLNDELYLVDIHCHEKVLRLEMDEERLLWHLRTVSNALLEKKLKRNLTEP